MVLGFLLLSRLEQDLDVWTSLPRLWQGGILVKFISLMDKEGYSRRDDDTSCPPQCAPVHSSVSSPRWCLLCLSISSMGKEHVPTWDFERASHNHRDPNKKHILIYLAQPQMPTFRNFAFTTSRGSRLWSVDYNCETDNLLWAVRILLFFKILAILSCTIYPHLNFKTGLKTQIWAIVPVIHIKWMSITDVDCSLLWDGQLYSLGSSLFQYLRRYYPPPYS